MFKKSYIKELNQECAQRLVRKNCKDYLKSLIELKGPYDKFHPHALFHGGENLCWGNGSSTDYMLITTKLKDVSTEHTNYSIFFSRRKYPDRKKSLFLGSHCKASRHGVHGNNLFLAFPYDSCEMAAFTYKLDSSSSPSHDAFWMMSEFFKGHPEARGLFKKYNVQYDVRSTEGANDLMIKMSKKDAKSLTPAFSCFIKDKICVSSASKIVKKKPLEGWCSGKIILVKSTDDNMSKIEDCMTQYANSLCSSTIWQYWLKILS